MSMNWESITFGLYAIVGSVIIAMFALIGHWITQKNENVRNARKLAYEAAIAEFKTDYEMYMKHMQSAPDTETEATLQMGDYILSHLALVDELQQIDVATCSAEQLMPILRRSRERDISILSLRREMQKNPNIP